jgi:hypothetical protein
VHLRACGLAGLSNNRSSHQSARKVRWFGDQIPETLRFNGPSCPKSSCSLRGGDALAWASLDSTWAAVTAPVALGLVTGVLALDDAGDAVRGLDSSLAFSARCRSAGGVARTGRVLRRSCRAGGGGASARSCAVGVRGTRHDGVQPRRSDRVAHAAVHRIARLHGLDRCASPSNPCCSPRWRRARCRCRT